MTIPSVSKFIIFLSLLCLFCVPFVSGSLTCNNTTTSFASSVGSYGIHGFMFSTSDITTWASWYSMTGDYQDNGDHFTSDGSYSCDILIGTQAWPSGSVADKGECTVTVSSSQHHVEISDISIDVSGLSGAKYVIIYRKDEGDLWSGGHAHTGYSYSGNYPLLYSDKNSGSYYCGGTPYVYTELCFGTPPPVYAVELTATGTFCYGNTIYFNLSETAEQSYGLYDIACYRNGNGVAAHFKTDICDGPLLYNVVLEPGEWDCMGSWTGDDTTVETWLNFTIDSTCTAQTFNGTFNSSSLPSSYIPNFTWTINNFNYSAIAPWEVPTFDNGNGTSFVDYLYHNGYINQSEYNEVMENVYYYQNVSTNNSAVTDNYAQGILTPLYMINDSVSVVRANINGSYIVLSNGISPITNIFTWIFQIIPSWVINLMTIGLTFDAARIILYGRKN